MRVRPRQRPCEADLALPHIDWFYPGIGLKRWLLLGAAGAIVFVYSLIVLVRRAPF